MARKLRKNKKGSLDDLIFIFVSLFAIAVIILIVYKVSDSINTELQASSNINDRGKAAYNSINNMYPGVVDNSIMLLAFGLGIMAIIFAMLIRVHPVFFVFFIIILAIIIFVCGAFSNVYQEMAANPELSVLADNLKFTTAILTFLPFIIGILGFIVAIVMYKNFQNA